MNSNYLSPIGFKINVKRLPNVEFFTQKVIIPGINTNAPEIPSPLTTLYSTGDRLIYQELDLSFIVDENMSNYKECLNWMESLTSTEELAQYSKLAKSDEGTVSDITITILNSHKNANLQFTFLDCSPVSLTGVSLDTTQSDVFYPEASITFRYDRFKFSNIG